MHHNPQGLQLNDDPDQTEESQHPQAQDRVPPTTPHVGGGNQHQHHLVTCNNHHTCTNYSQENVCITVIVHW